MAHNDSIVFPPGTGVLGSRQGTIEIILRAVRLGLYTAAEARLLIDGVGASNGPGPSEVDRLEETVS